MVNGASHSAMLDPHQINILNIYIATKTHGTERYQETVLHNVTHSCAHTIQTDITMAAVL